MAAAVRAVRKADRDRCGGLAAQLAYYFILAAFPALFLFVVLLGALPIDVQLAAALAALAQVAPPDVIALLEEQLAAIEGGKHDGLLTAGLAGAAWTSSVAMVALIDALNVVFDVKERRPWWKRRVVALWLTLVTGAAAAAVFALAVAGSTAGLWIARQFGVGQTFGVAWSWARWPLASVLVVLGLDLLYHFAPNREAAWRWLSPGAVLGASGWLLASLGLRLYLDRLPNLAATYGAIGGVIVALLWFYVSGMMILLGGELDAVTETVERRSESLHARAACPPQHPPDHRRG